VPAACDRDAVASAVRQGLETIARKHRWSGAGAAGPVSFPVGDGPAATDDPVTHALRSAEAAQANAATEAERARGAERRWPEVSQVARDRATPVKARLEALRAYAETYAGTDWAREAEKLTASLEAEPGRATDAETRRASSPEMVMVPAGEFFYGCNARRDSACDDDEKPEEMVGNVWEWCEEEYSAGKRALRGGSWSSRRRNDPGGRFGDDGFRCAQSAE
jgi:hypothetical protein